MKQYLFAALFFAFTGCADDTSADRTADSAADSSKQARDTVAVTDDSAAAKSSALQDTLTPQLNTIKKKFRVYFTTSYCGGAKPTDEIISHHQTQRLLTSSNLKLKEHFSGRAYTLSTNASGEGEAELEPGKYDVYLTQNINASLNTGFDAKCSLWINKSLFTVKVSDDGTTQDVTVHFECNPCDENSKKRP